MRCQAKTKSGVRCKNKALTGSNRCGIHSGVSAPSEVAPQRLYFKDALYYPFVEIHNETWLKTISLYWDSISTIVPSRVTPYKSQTARYLKDSGILSPLFVNPDLPELRDVAEDVIDFLNSFEGRNLVLSLSRSPRVKVSVEKFSNNLKWDLMYHSKFSHSLVMELQRLGVAGRVRASRLRVPEPFAHFYMTLLATRLASKEGRSLLTDIVPAENLATKATLGGSVPATRQGRVPGGIAEGILASMVLKTISVGPRTTIKRIISFREKHASEMARFRAAIRELVESLSGGIDANLLSSHLRTIYKDNVAPAIEDLRGRLRDNRISCGFNNLKLSTLMSTSPTVLGSVLSGTSLGPFALVAGIGLSIVLATANYKVQRRDILRGSPFSYVISAEKELGKR